MVSLLILCPSLSIDARNDVGVTALMKAALQGRVRCTRLLLLAGEQHLHYLSLDLIELASTSAVRPELRLNWLQLNDLWLPSPSLLLVDFIGFFFVRLGLAGVVLALILINNRLRIIDQVPMCNQYWKNREANDLNATRFIVDSFKDVADHFQAFSRVILDVSKKILQIWMERLPPPCL